MPTAPPPPPPPSLPPPSRPSPNPAPIRRDPDVLVIGGGAVGLFCAYYLRRAGYGVTVVERGPLGGPQSCSYGNTGFVGTQGALPLAEPGVMAQGLRWLLNPESPFYIRPRPDPELLSWLWHFRRACNERDAKAGFRVLVDMKKRSLDILRELCAPGDLASTFTAQGMLLAYRTPQGFEKARLSVPGTVASGVPLRVLEPGELSVLEPDAEFDICGALYNEEGAYLRVPEFVTGLARTLDGMGVEIHERTEVVGIEAAGREIRRVRTTRGDLSPRETVVAAGTWSAECARGLDLGLRLQPAKGTPSRSRHRPTRPGCRSCWARGRSRSCPSATASASAGPWSCRAWTPRSPAAAWTASCEPSTPTFRNWRAPRSWKPGAASAPAARTAFPTWDAPTPTATSPSRAATATSAWVSRRSAAG